MVIVLAAIMAAVAFVILTRLLWLSKRPSSSTVITLAAVGLVVGLAVLAATGRLHWLAAVGAALLPFLKRGVSLIRFLPLFRGLFGAYQNSRGGNQSNTAPDPSEMTPDHAREVLDLGSNPSRDEVIAAHRRLMQKIHPDRGGSTYLAQQLNEAKRILLKNAR